VADFHGKKNLANKEYVGNEKMRYMEDIPTLMRDCFHGNHPVEIQRYLEYVSSLKYQQEPDYEHIRKLLKDGLKRRGFTDDGKSVKFTPPACASPATADVFNGHDSEQETRDRSTRRRPASRKRKSEDAEETKNQSPVKKSRTNPVKKRAT